MRRTQKKSRKRARKKDRKDNRKNTRTRRKTRKARGIASEFTKKALMINNLPKLNQDTKREIIKEIKRDDAAKMIQTVNRDYKLKRLKQEFTIYERNEGDPNQLDPMDRELAELLERAVKILTINDIKNKYWKKILGKIYIGLHENENQDGPGARFYNRTENSFQVLVKRLLDYNFTNNQDYLRSEYLYNELVIPILGDPETM